MFAKREGQGTAVREGASRESRLEDSETGPPGQEACTQTQMRVMHKKGPKGPCGAGSAGRNRVMAAGQAHGGIVCISQRPGHQPLPLGWGARHGRCRVRARGPGSVSKFQYHLAKQLGSRMSRTPPLWTVVCKGNMLFLRRPGWAGAGVLHGE